MSRFREYAATTKGNARLTALAVFLGLYLAVGMGLAGAGNLFNLDPWMALFWPYHMRLLWRAVLVVLFAFATVSAFVYWLKLRLRLASEESARAWSLEMTNCPEPGRGSAAGSAGRQKGAGRGTGWRFGPAASGEA